MSGEQTAHRNLLNGRATVLETVCVGSIPTLHGLNEPNKSFCTVQGKFKLPPNRAFLCYLSRMVTRQLGKLEIWVRFPEVAL